MNALTYAGLAMTMKKMTKRKKQAQLQIHPQAQGRELGKIIRTGFVSELSHYA